MRKSCVSLKGEQPEELKKIVDMVVEKYLQEVVQHEHDLCLANEDRLERTLQQYKADLIVQRDSLHKMEMLHKVSSTESSQMRKHMAVQQLDASAALCAKLRDRLDDTEMQIAVLEAQEELSKDKRTADTGAPAQKPVANDQNLASLKARQEYLEKDCPGSIGNRGADRRTGTHVEFLRASRCQATGIAGDGENHE